jgi:predicted  nucleic acid-binding Zn-ribbon protein
MSNLRIPCLIVISCYCLLLFAGCHTNKYPKEIALLDSLQQVLTESSKQYHSLDTLEVQKIFGEIQSDLKFIRAHHKVTDTLTKQVAQQLNAYAQVYGVMAALIERQHAVEKELLYSMKQLQSLKTDIEKKQWEEKEVQTYCEQEKEAVQHLQQVVVKALQAYTENRTRYNELKPEIALLKGDLLSAESIDKNKK